MTSAPTGTSGRTETAPTRPTARQLTFIGATRLLPSFCILASHLSFEQVFKNSAVQEAYYRVFNPAGFNAVSFFIVLSGFILTWISAERPPDRGFQARRLLRILPVHFLTWAVIVCAFAATFAAPGLFTTLTLLQGWFPNHDVYWAANAPAWTLSTELVLYAVFPAVYRFLLRRGDRFLFGLLAGLVAVVVLLPVVLQLLPDSTTFANAAFTERGHLVRVSEWKYWLVYVFPLTRLLEALCGMLICLLVLRGRWIRNVWAPTALLLLAVVVEELWAPILFDLTALTIVPIVLLIGALAAREIARWRAPDAAENRAVTRVSTYGKYTFGIYMYQWAFILVCQRYVHPWDNSVAGGVLFVLAFYALCVAVSMASYRFFETPVNRFMKPAIAAFAKRRPTTSPSP
ncbi:acyltransferase [Kitasatospora sp. SUK 42]|uniref:acyltransferase family protein n=1 Tax=Kitasatospora sp. SUK 42 TaxID=1588882 RepID=UPI0018C953C9|nr:acyltransferase [Kitasatospora sp. SUK 42]MBV2156645.1 acyltransferase [Kitasatospora sp. SUK 42]